MKLKNEIKYMKPNQVVSNFLSNIEKKEFKKANDLLTEDFTFKGPIIDPLDKAEYMKLNKSLLKGLSDFNYNASNIREENGKIKVNIQITAKHTASIDLQVINLPSIRTTHKEISVPTEIFEISVTEGKIKKMQSLTPDVVGLIGVLKQLGPKSPQFNSNKGPAL